MSDWIIAPCPPDDLPAVVALVNSAYRGDTAQAGWTHEADYLDGQRTSLEDLRQELSSPLQPELLTLRRAGEPDLLACVMIEPHLEPGGGGYAYIGMVTVRPTLQAGGLGRRILEAAEDRARAMGADRAQMTVISIRDTLIAWYERRGYRLTGETRPFPQEARFGVPRRADLAFVVLEKSLTEGM